MLTAVRAAVRAGAAAPRAPARALHTSAAVCTNKLQAEFERLADPARAPRDLRFAIPPGKKYVTVDTAVRSKRRAPDGWALDPDTGRARRVAVSRTPDEQAAYDAAKLRAAQAKPNSMHQVFLGRGKLNPYLPSRTPEGLYRPPKYSAMTQARKIKAAYADGTDLALPPSPKKTQYQARIDWWKEQKIREANADPVADAAFNTAFSIAAKQLSPDQDAVFAYQCAKYMLGDQGAYAGRRIFWKGTKRVKRAIKRRAIIEERLKAMPELIREYKEVRLPPPTVCCVGLSAPLTLHLLCPSRTGTRRRLGQPARSPSKFQVWLYCAAPPPLNLLRSAREWSDPQPHSDNDSYALRTGTLDSSLT